MTLHFAGVAGVLHTRSSASALGFELCGPAPGSCRYASARASGSDVTIMGDGAPVTRVRYTWADFPVLNLVDDAELPAGPFELALR